MPEKLKFVFCHRMPERSFFFRGKQFPVCARCTGVYMGYLSIIPFAFSLISINFWFSCLLLLPTVVDGLTQAYCKRESNNFIRVTTGFCAGIGAMSIMSIIGESIGFFVLEIIR
ncbi:DUF2085 domain-containing protein [Dysgonomonas sp. 216]|uniref:DUF2085 domain-containing protein n=1 Tax=Dysgonomonas sp. 216 TaxID=2302934 RepID=UPI0013D45468|nr:DUF2085 domain-containing protein [Dysgonomonas sp. 216]